VTPRSYVLRHVAHPRLYDLADFLSWLQVLPDYLRTNETFSVASCFYSVLLDCCARQSLNVSLVSAFHGWLLQGCRWGLVLECSVIRGVPEYARDDKL